MATFYACAFWILFVVLWAVILEWFGDRRSYCRRDLSELADSRYVCRLIGEALEIEAPGERVDQYVSWAIKERLKQEDQP